MPRASPAAKADRIKLALAISGLVVAGLVLAWNYGAFDSLFRSTPADPMAGLTDQEKAEIKRQEKQAEEQAKITPPS